MSLQKLFLFSTIFLVWVVVSTEERVLGMRPYIPKPTEIKTLVIETMGILTLVIDVEKIQLC